MNIRELRSRVAVLAAKVPPPRGKDPVFVLAANGPRPADALADGSTFVHWWYAGPQELRDLEERFEREYGPSTRGPNDPPCLFIRLTDADEIQAMAASEVQS
jgi:hypothetical protein